MLYPSIPCYKGFCRYGILFLHFCSYFPYFPWYLRPRLLIGNVSLFSSSDISPCICIPRLKLPVWLFKCLYFCLVCLFLYTDCVVLTYLFYWGLFQDSFWPVTSYLFIHSRTSVFCDQHDLHLRDSRNSLLLAWTTPHIVMWRITEYFKAVHSNKLWIFKHRLCVSKRKTSACIHYLKWK